MTDTERLDWLHEKRAQFSYGISEWLIQIHVGSRGSKQGLQFYSWTAPTLRDVIDKAAAALPLAVPAPTDEPEQKGGS